MQHGMPTLDKDVKRKQEIMRQKREELHELPFTEIVKSGTIRLAPGFP